MASPIKTAKSAIEGVVGKVDQVARKMSDGVKAAVANLTGFETELNHTLGQIRHTRDEFIALRDQVTEESNKVGEGRKRTVKAAYNLQELANRVRAARYFDDMAALEDEINRIFVAVNRVNQLKAVFSGQLQQANNLLMSFEANPQLKEQYREEFTSLKTLVEQFNTDTQIAQSNYISYKEQFNRLEQSIDNEELIAVKSIFDAKKAALQVQQAEADAEVTRAAAVEASRPRSGSDTDYQAMPNPQLDEPAPVAASGAVLNSGTATQNSTERRQSIVADLDELVITPVVDPSASSAAEVTRARSSSQTSYDVMPETRERTGSQTPYDLMPEDENLPQTRPRTGSQTDYHLMPKPALRDAQLNVQTEVLTGTPSNINTSTETTPEKAILLVKLAELEEHQAKGDLVMNDLDQLLLEPINRSLITGNSEIANSVKKLNSAIVESYAATLFNMFREIMLQSSVEELLNIPYKDKPLKEGESPRSPNIVKLYTLADQIAVYIQSSVANTSDLGHQSLIIERWIQIANVCFQNNNFAAFKACVSAIYSLETTRSDLYASLSPATKNQIQEFLKLNSASNLSKKTFEAVGAVIPFMGSDFGALMQSAENEHVANAPASERTKELASTPAGQKVLATFKTAKASLTNAQDGASVPELAAAIQSISTAEKDVEASQQRFQTKLKGAADISAQLASVLKVDTDATKANSATLSQQAGQLLVNEAAILLSQLEQKQQALALPVVDKQALFSDSNSNEFVSKYIAIQSTIRQLSAFMAAFDLHNKNPQDEVNELRKKLQGMQDYFNAQLKAAKTQIAEINQAWVAQKAQQNEGTHPVELDIQQKFARLERLGTELSEARDKAHWMEKAASKSINDEVPTYLAVTQQKRFLSAIFGLTEEQRSLLQTLPTYLLSLETNLDNNSYILKKVRGEIDQLKPTLTDYTIATLTSQFDHPLKAICIYQAIQQQLEQQIDLYNQSVALTEALGMDKAKLNELKLWLYTNGVGPGFATIRKQYQNISAEVAHYGSKLNADNVFHRDIESALSSNTTSDKDRVKYIAEMKAQTARYKEFEKQLKLLLVQLPAFETGLFNLNKMGIDAKRADEVKALRESLSTQITIVSDILKNYQALLAKEVMRQAEQHSVGNWQHTMPTPAAQAAVAQKAPVQTELHTRRDSVIVVKDKNANSRPTIAKHRVEAAAGLEYEQNGLQFTYHNLASSSVADSTTKAQHNYENQKRLLEHMCYKFLCERQKQYLNAEIAQIDARLAQSEAQREQPSMEVPDETVVLEGDSKLVRKACIILLAIKPDLNILANGKKYEPSVMELAEINTKQTAYRTPDGLLGENSAFSLPERQSNSRKESMVKGFSTIVNNLRSH